MKQHKRQQKITAAERVYALFVHLYPREHRQAYGPLMLQTFKDSYRDARETEGGIGMKFWLAVAADEVKSIAGDHIASLRKGEQSIKKFTTVAFVVGISLLLLIFWFLGTPSGKPDSIISTIRLVAQNVWVATPIILLLCCPSSHFSEKSQTLKHTVKEGGLLSILLFGAYMIPYAQ